MDIASRLALTTRGGRLLERLPRLTVYSAAELLLLVLIAVQGARLIWTPRSRRSAPVGDWKAVLRSGAPASSSVLAGFDPFFRLSAGGPVVVTALNLKLHGVREDRATGRGSAIIALPDGRQMSFAVGEEIMPGVTLTAVGFDNVTISRAGAPSRSSSTSPSRRRPSRRRRRRRRRAAGRAAGGDADAARRPRPPARRSTSSRASPAAGSTASSSRPAATAARRSAPPASSPAT